MKKTYQMIALDMDGTVLNDEKKIDPITLSAMKRALALGKEIVFCTGRPYCGMGDYLKLIPEMRYLCLESGALIYDIRQNRPLCSSCISTDTVLKIRDLIAGRDIMAEIFHDGQFFLNRAQGKRLPHYNMAPFVQYYQTYMTPVDMDIFEYAQMNPFGAEKLNLYHTSPEERKKTLELLEKEQLPITMAFSEVSSLECTAAGVSKASGLEALCRHLGITMEEVIMVGDSDNDREALMAAGLSVAMKNASPSIFNLCDVQVSDNNHNGCAEAIEFLFR